MMNGKKQAIDDIVEKYKQAKGITDGIIDSHDLAGWALANDLYKPSRQDEIKLAAEAFSRHFREEMRTSKDGKRYRAKHAVKTKRNGKQMTLWADMDDLNVPVSHFDRAFIQRRQQIVGDCVQLKTDVDVCNEKRGSNIPLLLDFTEDVAEAEYLRDQDKGEDAA